MMVRQCYVCAFVGVVLRWLSWGARIVSWPITVLASIMPGTFVGKWLATLLVRSNKGRVFAAFVATSLSVPGLGLIFLFDERLANRILFVWCLAMVLAFFASWMVFPRIGARVVAFLTHRAADIHLFRALWQCEKDRINDDLRATIEDVVHAGVTEIRMYSPLLCVPRRLERLLQDVSEVLLHVQPGQKWKEEIGKRKYLRVAKSAEFRLAYPDTAAAIERASDPYVRFLGIPSCLRLVRTRKITFRVVSARADDSALSTPLVA